MLFLASKQAYCKAKSIYKISQHKPLHITGAALTNEDYIFFFSFPLKPEVFHFSDDLT